MENSIEQGKVAVIDIGSNSLRFVVFDSYGRYPYPLFNERITCRLGEGVQKTKKLKKDRIQQSLETIKRFSKIIDEAKLDNPFLKENSQLIVNKNIEKANLLYNAIDKNDLFTGFAKKEDRSLMNVTFNLINEEHKEHFDKLCNQANISGVNGHRSVGGYRASIYNALELSSVQVLIEVMEELKTKV